jgi:hypothetical protein
MAADDEIECALALPDSAFADDENAEAEDVEQYTVDGAAHGKVRLEPRREPCDRDRRRHRRLKHGHRRPVRFVHELRRRRKGVGHDEAGDASFEDAPGRAAARVRRERFEVAHLALAEHEHSPRAEELVIAGEREAGLLDVEIADTPPEALPAGEKHEVEIRRPGGLRQQGIYRNAVLAHASGSISPKCPSLRR